MKAQDFSSAIPSDSQSNSNVPGGELIGSLGNEPFKRKQSTLKSFGSKISKLGNKIKKNVPTSKQKGGANPEVEKFNSVSQSLG